MNGEISGYESAGWARVGLESSGSRGARSGQGTSCLNRLGVGDAVITDDRAEKWGWKRRVAKRLRAGWATASESEKEARK